MDLVFASNNTHKLSEAAAILANRASIKSLDAIGCMDDIPETGVTFQENALQKCMYIHDRYHVNVFADDSGLEVDGLNGEPGVYSARYSGTRDMDRNVALLLSRLANQTNRAAQFRTVIALILNERSFFFEGFIKGTITKALRGTNGFGYDPIFIPEGYDITFAEMALEEKNRISHRAIALNKFAEFLVNR